MKVNARLEDISDGKTYGLSDMVKADTRGCEGCSACCHGVGNTIVLTPFDMYEITRATGNGYDQLFGDKIELHTEEKLTLPNLKMVGVEEACGFLNDLERCDIHGFRPSICRLFPLGRYYEQDDFKYFFKEGECVKPNLSKVKVKRWIGINNYQTNKAFLMNWHKFLKALKWRVKFIHDEEELKEVNAYLIDHFYRVDFLGDEGFYQVFQNKVTDAKNKLGLL